MLMKTSLATYAVAIILGAWLTSTLAVAGIIFDVSPVTVTVTPTSSFDVTFTVDTQGATMVAYEFNLAVNAPGAGMFEVTGRSTVGSPFSNVLPVTHVWPDVLNPETNQLFGATVPNLVLSCLNLR